MKFVVFFLMFIFGCGGWNSAIAASQYTSSAQPVMMGSPARYYHDALEAEARGDLADASLALRRAVTIDPLFSQAQQKLNDLLVNIGVPLSSTWKTKLAAHCTPDLLVLIGSCFGWVAAFVGVWFFFTRCLAATTSTRKKNFFLLGMLVLFFSLGAVLVFLGTMIDPRISAADVMIVLPKNDFKTSASNHDERPSRMPLGTTALRATPVENATIVAQLPTGTALFLKSRHGAWSYIQIESGEEGWIDSSALQPLVPKKS